MTAPSLPTPGPNDVWGATVNAVIENEHTPQGFHKHGSIYVKTLVTSIDRICNSIASVGGQVLRGVFTPHASTVVVRFSCGATMYGVEQVFFDFLYTQSGTPGAPMNVSTVSAYKSQSRFHVGSLSAGPGVSTGRTYVLSGLTAGVPVSWELYLIDSTYASRIQVGAKPTYMDVVDYSGYGPSGRQVNGTAQVAQRYMAVSNHDDQTCQIVLIPNTWGDRPRFTTMATIPCGNISFYPRFSPDGAYLSIPVTGGTLIVVETTGFTVARTVTLPAGTLPVAVAHKSDGTVAWVTDDRSPGAIIPVTLATGAVGTPVVTNNGPIFCRRRPGTNEVWICCQTAGTIQVLDASTATITHTITLTGHTAPALIDFTPDASKAYVCCADAIVELTCASYAMSGRAVSVANAVGAVCPDNGTIAAADAGNVYWFDIATLTQYAIATLTGLKHIAVASEDGQLFYTINSNNQVFTYWGGTFFCDPPQNFALLGQWMEVVVEGATTGPGD